MGHRLNRLDEPVFMVGPKPMRTEFVIHQRLESCEMYLKQKARQGKKGPTVVTDLAYAPRSVEQADKVLVFSFSSLLLRRKREG